MNCVRRNTFLNVASQLKRKDGWKLLVLQLKERMNRRESEDPCAPITLKEFQKYDSAFPTYRQGNTCRSLFIASEHHCLARLSSVPSWHKLVPRAFPFKPSKGEALGTRLFVA